LIGFILNLSVLGIFNVFDPIGDAISDVEFTDIVFSEIRESPVREDSNIVIVNIGKLERAQLAMQINIINQFGPKAIGIDSFFSFPKDSAGDAALYNALSSVDNLVMASQLMEYNETYNRFDSLKKSFSWVAPPGNSGFANLFTNAAEQDRFKVCRTFPPGMKTKEDTVYAFAVELARILSPEKTERFLARRNEEEIINYKRNILSYDMSQISGQYTAIDVQDVFQLNFEPRIIKDKIVLFGFLGEDFYDKSWKDKFYTPLNVNYAGRSNPDMYGVVIHANIISMILDEDYLYQQSRWASIMWAIILCVINVYGFMIIYHRLPQWYDGLTKTIQLIEILLLLFVTVMSFHWFNYKLELTLATAVIALAGDSLEVYKGLIMNLFTKKGRKNIFRIQN
jgi:CHASE2 domain-containing sensor protein